MTKIEMRLFERCCLRFVALSIVGSHITTKDQQLQQQANDLRLLQTRPHSEFISAYGYEEGEEAAEGPEKKQVERPKSDLFLSKDIEMKLESGHTGTMRDRKNRLEKLDLQPMAFEVPRVPDDATKKGERKAPEGEEGKRNVQDGLSSPLKKFPRGSHDETRFLESDDLKQKSSDDYSSDSGEESGDTPEEKYPTVIRRHPRTSGNPQNSEIRLNDNRRLSGEQGNRNTLTSFVNPNYHHEQEIEDIVLRNERSASMKSTKSQNTSTFKEDHNISSSSMTPRSPHKYENQAETDVKQMESPRKNTSLLEEIIASKQNLHKSKSPQSYKKESRKGLGYNTGYKSETDLWEKGREERGPRESINSAKGMKGRSKSNTSLMMSDYDDDVFIKQKEATDRGLRGNLNRQAKERSVSMRRSPQDRYKGRDDYDDYERFDARSVERGSKTPDLKLNAKSSYRRSREIFEEMSDARPDRKSSGRSDEWSDERSDAQREIRSSRKHDRRSGRMSAGLSDERSNVKSNRRSDRRTDWKSDEKSDARYDRRSGRKSEPRSDVRSDRRPGLKSEGQSDVRANRKSGWKSEGQSDVRSSRHSDRRSDEWSDTRSAGTSDLRLNSRSGERTDMKSDRWSDGRSDRASYRSRREESDESNEWEVDIDDYSDAPVRNGRIRSRNDEDDTEYRKLVKNLTRGRARTSYDDEIMRRDDEKTRRTRSKSQRGLYLRFTCVNQRGLCIKCYFVK